MTANFDMKLGKTFFLVLEFCLSLLFQTIKVNFHIKLPCMMELNIPVTVVNITDIQHQMMGPTNDKTVTHSHTRIVQKFTKQIYCTLHATLEIKCA